MNRSAPTATVYLQTCGRHVRSLVWHRSSRYGCQAEFNCWRRVDDRCGNRVFEWVSERPQIKSEHFVVSKPSRVDLGQLGRPFLSTCRFVQRGYYAHNRASPAKLTPSERVCRARAARPRRLINRGRSWPSPWRHWAAITRTATACCTSAKSQRGDGSEKQPDQ